jgi:hypothetical protein
MLCKYTTTTQMHKYTIRARAQIYDHSERVDTQPRRRRRCTATGQVYDYDGWSCKVGGCTAVSINDEVTRQHCRRAHGLQVKAGGVVSGVRLQKVFGSKRQYFVVTVAEVDLRRPRNDGLTPSPPPLRRRCRTRR